MSTAYAGTDLYAVVPDVSASGFGPAAAQPDVASLTMPDTTGVQDLTDAASGHVTDAATHAGDALGHTVDHAVQAAADQVHDMVVPALLGLADLSGALLVARLAVRGTVALATFNNKVAADQEALAHRQMSLEEGSECWRRAAEAAAGLNARITVLGLGPAGPGDGPPPAPVQPVGVPLDLLWKRLAETERAVRRVEAQRASRATARLPFQHTEDPERADWYDRLREERRRVLREYAEGGAAPGSEALGSEAAPDTPPATALTEEDVLDEGARLLAGLPLSFTSESRELIDDCLLEARRAVTGRPTAVRRYLDEAAIIAHNESVRARRSEEARRDAALRLAALQAPAPEGVDPLPQALAAVDVLERVLRDGVPASTADGRLVEQALAVRSAVLHRAYLVAALRRASEQWGEGSVHARADTEHWDFAPAAWGGEYWLRVRLNASGQARVLTMRRPLTPEEAADPDVVRQQQARDAERCAESSRYVDDLGPLSEAEGVRAEFSWSESGVLTGEPAPGLTDAFRTGATGEGTRPAARAGQAGRARRRPGREPKYRQRDGN
ncbi:hypothetical protein [Streptomyces sp. NPDC047070]|uniref:hypothetical protein n=1 Tax=Streptomyces sp. NPDC047070 TaxID=3154923 RepID=UPI003452EC6D